MKPTPQLNAADIRPLPIAEAGEAQNAFLLPSMVFVGDEGLLFGAAAQNAARRSEQQGREAFISPKQYLSTHLEEELDGPVPQSVDPLGRYTARQLIVMYLSFLLKRADRAATGLGKDWPPRLRVARPAWVRERAQWGEERLCEMVRQAIFAVDQAGDQLLASSISHDVVAAALQAQPDVYEDEEELIFMFSKRGLATVTEAAAVAAGTIRTRRDRRRVVVVADIGGGTSDFAAFMTGLPGRNVLSQIEGSSQVVRRAGDFLDMQLFRILAERAGLVADDPAARGPLKILRARQRTLKEILFTQGAVVEEVNDRQIQVTREEFLADEQVVHFDQMLRLAFNKAFDKAMTVARGFGRGRRLPIEVMPTGGGHGLPMVQKMAAEPGRAWESVVVHPQFPIDDDEDFQKVFRQLTVSIGGAVRDLPQELAPISALRRT